MIPISLMPPDVLGIQIRFLRGKSGFSFFVLFNVALRDHSSEKYFQACLVFTFFSRVRPNIFEANLIYKIERIKYKLHTFDFINCNSFKSITFDFRSIFVRFHLKCFMNQHSLWLKTKQHFKKVNTEIITEYSYFRSNGITFFVWLKSMYVSDQPIVNVFLAILGFCGPFDNF